MTTVDNQLQPLPHRPAVPPIQEKLDYADLAVIDLAKAATPEGRAELVVQLCDAMRDVGFFYVINHGYTQEQNNRIFDIAEATFAQVSDEEKRRYEGNLPVTGTYQGYKLQNYWEIDNGVKDKVEQYNVHRDSSKREHPEFLRPFLPEIDAFCQHSHYNVVHPLLRLLATALELPEDALARLHNFDGVGESAVRFMKYHPRTQDEEEKTKQTWLKGHTDIGCLSVLWSQPISGLQVLSPDGKWRWIKHIDNALVINAGDTLEFLSGGYFRATIHRVIQPIVEQRSLGRLAVIYFAMADDHVKLTPLSESPVLQRNGIKRRFSDEDAPTMEDWRTGITKAYGKTQLKQTEEGVQEELVHGVVVKHFY